MRSLRSAEFSSTIQQQASRTFLPTHPKRSVSCSRKPLTLTSVSTENARYAAFSASYHLFLEDTFPLRMKLEMDGSESHCWEILEVLGSSSRPFKRWDYTPKSFF